MTAVQEKRETVLSKRLAGKVALVTGGSRGIGAAIALRLAGEGAVVAVTFNKDKSGADKVVGELEKLGAKAFAFQANVTSEEDNAKLIDQVIKAAGKIDILVNNAGAFEQAPIDQVELAQYDRLFNVNVKGVVATTIAALKKISDGGRIINISSGVVRMSMPGASLYTATKSALDALTRVWAQDLGARRITVNGVAPGTTDTEMLNNGLPEEAKQYMISKTALGRLGEPDDIAAVVAFLASEDGRWVTGHTIAADGGINI